MTTTHEEGLTTPETIEIKVQKTGVPELRNWHVSSWLSTQGSGDTQGPVVAYGEVYNDTRWPDGTPIRTSAVQYVRAGQLRTKNTTYKLGNMQGCD